MTLRVAQFFLKIAHLSFSMGPRGPRAYGLRPRLWLLVLCKSCRSGSVFAREKRFIRGTFFRTRGTGPSLYTDKHCRIRKTNMATVWRFRRGFTSVFSLLKRSQRWSQFTDSTKENIAISSALGSILLARNVSFYGRSVYIELPCI